MIGRFYAGLSPRKPTGSLIRHFDTASSTSPHVKEQNLCSDTVKTTLMIGRYIYNARYILPRIEEIGNRDIDFD